MRSPVLKTCEACGDPFTCGGYGCWCGQIGITEKQMDWIAARFQECLCPDCLKKVSHGDLSLVPKRSDRPGS